MISFLRNHCRATGITTAVVESMEQNFKKDVLCELIVGGGRILLHDEIEERPGVFSIIPLWETVSEGDILTPRDVMDLVAKEGYKVGSAGLLIRLANIFRQINYGRVAIASYSFFTSNESS